MLEEARPLQEAEGGPVVEATAPEELEVDTGFDSVGIGGNIAG